LSHPNFTRELVHNYDGIATDIDYTVEPGPISGYAARDGGSNEIDYSAIAADIGIDNTSITVAFWNNSFSSGSASAFGNEVSDGRINCHGPWTGNTLYWDFSGQIGVDERASTDYTAYANKWTHVVLTAGATQDIWFNGVRVASEAFTYGTAVDTTNFYLHTYKGGATFPHNGALTHFSIWPRQLSDAEVYALYDPATRWDLYWQPKVMVPVFIGAAGAHAGPSTAQERRCAAGFPFPLFTVTPEAG
jgi:hypothetical protein